MEVKAADFATDTPPPRLMGVENEYDVQCPVDQIQQLLVQGIGASPELYAVSTDPCKAIGFFLVNGSKVYYDARHLEYAASECIGGRQTTLAQRAGRSIVARTADRATDIEHKGIYDRAVSVNYDDPRMPDLTSGYHQNYCIPKNTETILRIRRHLPSYLATEIIFTGSGYLSHKGYRMSQKASGVGQAFSWGVGQFRQTEGRKPMAMVTDDGGNSELTRFEARCKDPTPSWYANSLGMNTTSLALRLTETAYYCALPKLPELSRPDIAMKMLSKDITMQVKLDLADGKRATAAEIQLRYAEAWLELRDVVELDPEEHDAADQHYNLMEQLHAAEGKSIDELAEFWDRISWIARALRISRRLEPQALDSMSLAAVKIDLAWDRVDVPGRGQQVYDDVIGAKEVHEATIYETSASESTRATLREKVLRTYGRSHPVIVDWTEIIIGGVGKIKTDPYQTELPALAA